MPNTTLTRRTVLRTPFPLFWPFCVASAVVGTAAMIITARSGCVADLITGGAVPEYGPTEILPPVGPMLPRPACLCRPRRSSRPGHPRKTAASRPRKANSRERQVRT